MSKFEGIYAATVSVLNNDLSLNIDKTINHAETIIDNGCHGAAIFGSTGQAQLLSISEKINLLNKLSLSKHNYYKRYNYSNQNKYGSKYNFSSFFLMISN